jgi:hypothetical protein
MTPSVVPEHDRRSTEPPRLGKWHLPWAFETVKAAFQAEYPLQWNQ